jgi:hypothetical protein
MGCNNPVRLQLSRARGLNLQDVSIATNGLPAVNVARPGKFGNPFSITFCQAWFLIPPNAARRQAVRLHRKWIKGRLSKGWTEKVPPPLDELPGKNLACWCKLDQPCYADVLLELANSAA